jgi:hypothetical protein
MSYACPVVEQQLEHRGQSLIASEAARKNTSQQRLDWWNAIYEVLASFAQPLEQFVVHGLASFRPIQILLALRPSEPAINFVFGSGMCEHQGGSSDLQVSGATFGNHTAESGCRPVSNLLVWIRQGYRTTLQAYPTGRMFRGQSSTGDSDAKGHVSEIHASHDGYRIRTPCR